MAEYQFKPHEQPMVPGSPATPDHPMQRRVLYFCIGIILSTYGGLQNGLMLANLSILQAERALTPVEGGWIKAAYYIPYACMSMMLYRTRQHMGIQFFVRLALWALLAANFIQLFVATYWAEIVSRALSALASSGMMSLSIFYFMQSLSAERRLAGVLMGIGLFQLGMPLARVMSPTLLISGDITPLFVLQFALTLVVGALVNLFPLPPGRRIHVFRKLDLISFPLLAGGMGLLFAFLIQGMIIWWDKPWLGYALAGAVLMIGLALFIERNRPYPMLELRWLGTKEVAILAATGALSRLVLSEQNYGATSLLATVGMSADQMVTYNWVLIGATLLAVVMGIVRLDITDLQRPIPIAFALITVAAFLDSKSGVASRPQDFYLTQAMMAFAAIYVMGPVMLAGMSHAVVRGPTYIVSFVAVFSLGQSLGSYVGAAVLFTLQTFETKAHLMDIAQTLSMSDPAVAHQISALAASNAPYLLDPAYQKAEGIGSLVQKATLEAHIEAYNDSFYVMGWLAAVAFALMLFSWLKGRWNGEIPGVAQVLALRAKLARNR